MSNNGWSLRGYEPVDRVYFVIEGSFDSMEQAELAAQKYLQMLEKTQPTSNSGGQSAKGIQDRVLIVSPEGEEERVFPRVKIWKHELKDCCSYNELLSTMGGSRETVEKNAIQILLSMFKFIVQNVDLSKNIAAIRDAVKGKQYNKLMSLLEKIYQEEYLKNGKFSHKTTTLLEKILSEAYPVCPRCNAIGQTAKGYAAGVDNGQNIKKFNCPECATSF